MVDKYGFELIAGKSIPKEGSYKPCAALYIRRVYDASVYPTEYTNIRSAFVFEDVDHAFNYLSELKLTDLPRERLASLCSEFRNKGYYIF